MLAWLDRAGIKPSDLSRLKCVHVAGTKGKGSVCAYLTSILTQPAIQSTAGRVGTYTSPHLITVRERIQLDGSPITQQLFAKYFFEVWDAFTASARLKARTERLDISDEDLEGPGTKPFFFRFLTIMAFHVFLKEGVKSAVIVIKVIFCAAAQDYLYANCSASTYTGEESLASSKISQLILPIRSPRPATHPNHTHENASDRAYTNPTRCRYQYANHLKTRAKRLRRANRSSND